MNILIGRRNVLSLLTAGLLVGCGDPPTLADESLEVAVIGFYHSDAPRITVPDTVAVGRLFEVSVESYGNSCVELAPTEVQLTAEGATVTPMTVVRSSANAPCLDILLAFLHEADVTLWDPGAATIAIRARERPHGPVLLFRRTVWVR